jgi:hypothetical protein
LKKIKLLFISLSIILLLLGIYAAYQGFMSYRINRILLNEQLKVNAKLNIVLPYIEKTDSLSRVYGCKYLCSLAVRASIDPVIPLLRHIAEKDTFKHIRYYNSMGGKPYGGKSGKQINYPSIQVRMPEDSSYPIREVADSAIELNENRHYFDSLLRHYRGSFNARVVKILIRSVSEQDRFQIPFVRHHAAVEFNRMPAADKNKELLKYDPASFSELCETVRMLSENNQHEIACFINKQIPKFPFSFSSHYRGNELFAVRNEKLISAARKNIMQIPKAPDAWYDDEWRNSIKYLSSCHDTFVVKYLISLLDDTLKYEPKRYTQMQTQSKTPQSDQIGKTSLEYVHRTNAYNLLASLFGFPNVYDIAATDLNVEILNKFLKAGLMNEIKPRTPYRGELLY